MAVISRVTTLELTGSLGTRRWTATAATQDTAAGSSVVVTVTITTTGVPPPTANSLDLSFRIDNGSTVVRTVSLTPGTASQQVTFHFTNTGNSGGSNRAGTIRMRIDAVNGTGTPTDRYTVNSDDTSGQVLGAGQSVTIRDQGWIRGTTTSTQTLSNQSLGGAKSSPFQYQDILYLRTTLGATLYSSRALTVAIGSARSGTTNSATSGNFDRTFSGTSATTGRVNKGFNPVNQNYVTNLTVPNASLTGQADFTVSNTSDNANIDPRVTMVHLLQINNNTYDTPPLSDPNIATERVFPDLGYLGTAIYPARGNKSGTTVTGGLNGLVFDIAYIDPTNANIGGTAFNTTTIGGEDGWQDTLLTWSNAVAGVHTKTVSITTSDLNDSGYWINNQITYALIATNPNLSASLIIGTNSPDNHFLAGSSLELDVQLMNTQDRVAVDPDQVDIVFRRVNSSDNAQYLDSTKTWVDAYTGDTPPVPVAADTHSPTQLSTDQFLYRLTCPTDSTWTNDFEVTAITTKDGVRYPVRVTKEVLGNAWRHGDDDSHNTGVVTTVYDSTQTDKQFTHLSPGHSLQAILIPRSSSGVDAAGTEITVSIRRSGTNGAEDLIDAVNDTWIGVSDGSHPNGGDFVFLTPTTILGNGVALQWLTADNIQSSYDVQSPWLIISALVIRDSGLPTENRSLETKVEYIYPPINTHDKRLSLS